MKDDRKVVLITQYGDGNIEIRVDYEVESDGISEWRHALNGRDFELNMGQINSAKGFLGQMVAKVVI